MGLVLSRFGKPEETLTVPESYWHRGRWIEVVQLKREITRDCFEWLLEQEKHCILHSSFPGGFTVYTPEKIRNGLERWAEERRDKQDIAPPMIVYAKFMGSEKAVEFKLTFADLFVE